MVLLDFGGCSKWQNINSGGCAEWQSRINFTDLSTNGQIITGFHNNLEILRNSKIENYLNLKPDAKLTLTSLRRVTLPKRHDASLRQCVTSQPGKFFFRFRKWNLAEKRQFVKKSFHWSVMSIFIEVHYNTSLKVFNFSKFLCDFKPLKSQTDLGDKI